MIKLCYKEYEWKASTEACKSFSDKTGLDLKSVFFDYLVCAINTPKGISLTDRMQMYSNVHSEKIAVTALHCIIKAGSDGVSIDEIADGCNRVGWLLSERPDDLSEPWPFVMVNTALDINSYFNANIPKKKEAGTEAGLTS
tara:strand:- start:908 stop:1330 length:423 start_codon:yes stop_codon:yes gene_type:complete